MIELAEYVYTIFTSPTITVKCRYCNSVIGGKDHSNVMFEKYLGNIEEDATIHLMQCKSFFEIKKSEIEECGI